MFYGDIMIKIRIEGSTDESKLTKIGWGELTSVESQQTVISKPSNIPISVPPYFTYESSFGFPYIELKEGTFTNNQIIHLGGFI
jgi:hypothetical protein